MSSVISKTILEWLGVEAAETLAVPPPFFEPMEERLLLSLLGVEVGLPDISYDATGLATYNATANTFDATAVPISFYLPGQTRPVQVQLPRDFLLHALVDDGGTLMGGAPGDDLKIDGNIDTDRTKPGYEYAGLLLTGEIVQFGYDGSNSTVAHYDFRFVPTGGSLMNDFFRDKDIGVTMLSEDRAGYSHFNGSFAMDFGGGAKGLVGPIPMLAASSLAGRVFVDADNDGVDDAEPGIQGVTVTLAGTNYRGAAVSLTATTDDAGAYQFTGVLPGTYTLTETQPDGYLDGQDAAGTFDGTVGNDVIANIKVGVGQAGTGYTFGELAPSSLSGRVWLDANNNGVIDGAETGIAGVTVTLTDAQGATLAATTDDAGAYQFTDLRPGSYTITETQPAGYLDGKDAAGTAGGTLGNDVVSAIPLASGVAATDYNFGETLPPSSLAGFAWVDFNDDGLIDFNEKAIAGVTITLTGADYRGTAVNRTTTTDEDGYYDFMDLLPGAYTIKETQPAGYLDGQDALGTVGGILGNDVFSQINLGVDVDGMSYNFGERPLAGTAVVAGQTATIGFWQNKNGQALLKALNGGSTATQLGNWLAVTFPNLYANLAGMTNTQIAAYYTNLFSAKKAVAGPTKVDCQVMAVAFAAYVTNASLAGTTAQKYGFRVTTYGVGQATVNIGSAGAAFGVANGSLITVIDALLASDALSYKGTLYGGQQTSLQTILRTLANDIYTRINEMGDIG